MARVSAGRLYFAVLGFAATLVLYMVLRSVSSLSGLSKGFVLGFALSEAVTLVAFPLLLGLFHVSLESKVPMSGVWDAFRRARPGVREVKEDRAVRLTRSIPLLNGLAERVERSIRSDVVKSGMQLDPYAFAARYS
ncbi:MAG: hypothetical protein JRM80_12475, partial [Nitrososphaerota archaeon]|nr:hypothetical protein [Nitrososphaerota archaeon]